MSEQIIEQDNNNNQLIIDSEIIESNKSDSIGFKEASEQAKQEKQVIENSDTEKTKSDNKKVEESKPKKLSKRQPIKIIVNNKNYKLPNTFLKKKEDYEKLSFESGQLDRVLTDYKLLLNNSKRIQEKIEECQNRYINVEEKLDKLNNELLKYKDRSDYLNIVEEMNQAIVKGFAEGYRVSEGYVNNQEVAYKEQLIAYKKYLASKEMEEYNEEDNYE